MAALVVASRQSGCYIMTVCVAYNKAKTTVICANELMVNDNIILGVNGNTDIK